MYQLVISTVGETVHIKGMVEIAICVVCCGVCVYLTEGVQERLVLDS